MPWKFLPLLVLCALAAYGISMGVRYDTSDGSKVVKAAGATWVIKQEAWHAQAGFVRGAALFRPLEVRSFKGSSAAVLYAQCRVMLDRVGPRIGQLYRIDLNFEWPGRGLVHDHGAAVPVIDGKCVTDNVSFLPFYMGSLEGWHISSVGNWGRRAGDEEMAYVRFSPRNGAEVDEAEFPFGTACAHLVQDRLALDIINAKLADLGRAPLLDDRFVLQAWESTESGQLRGISNSDVFQFAAGKCLYGKGRDA